MPDQDRKSSRTVEKLRFSVCDQGGNIASLWIANCRKSDLYLGAASVMGTCKISFHGSRICHLKYRSETKLRWTRSDSDEGELSLSCSIFYPTNYSRKFYPPDLHTKKEKIVVPVAEPGCAVEFGIFHSNLPAEASSERVSLWGRPIGYFGLENGGTIVFAARNCDFPDQWITNLLAKPIPAASLDTTSRLPNGNVSAFLINEPDKDGRLMIAVINGLSLL